MGKKNVLVIGGTGSLGKTLLRHFSEQYNMFVFSRDEAKHVFVKQHYPTVKSIIGDIRDRDAVFNAIVTSSPSIIINAAALKNVPEVEDVPMEAVKTSIIGNENVTKAALLYSLHSNQPVKVLMISTDKACRPVNAYGMAKALQERVHIRSNCDNLICNAVRYGNVLESRGSLIPYLKQCLKNDIQFYVTHPEMTRFFMTLDASVGLIKRALDDNSGGKVFIPMIKSARIVDVVRVFLKLYNKDTSLVEFSKIRPGEKINESLISPEEIMRTELKDGVYVIHDILTSKLFTDITEELSSASEGVLLDKDLLEIFLLESGVLNV
jgi:FlaA1/EpsC-like NDP-sugar epimerase